MGVGGEESAGAEGDLTGVVPVTEEELITLEFEMFREGTMTLERAELPPE